MAKTTLTFTEEAGRGYVSSFVAVTGREHIQVAKNYEGDGVTYLEASTDGETFAVIRQPMGGRDLLIPLETPDGVIIRVVSTDPVDYAAVVSDDYVQIPVDPTQTYYKNAISDYDGNWYDAVIIGSQVWLAQNLRTTHYADGTELTSQGSGGPSAQHSDSIPYYYKISNDKNAGLCYNQSAVLNGESSSELSPSGVQGISPNGWHIPSKLEFEQLVDYVKSKSEYIFNNDPNNYAKSLASKTGWTGSNVEFSIGNLQELNNKTGLSIYPAGGTNGSGGWYSPGGSGMLWSSTSLYSFRSTYASVSFFLSSYYRRCGLSVRCLCNLSPDNFRLWYVNTYHTNEHIV